MWCSWHGVLGSYSVLSRSRCGIDYRLALWVYRDWSSSCGQSPGWSPSRHEWRWEATRMVSGQHHLGGSDDDNQVFPLFQGAGFFDAYAADHLRAWDLPVEMRNMRDSGIMLDSAFTGSPRSSCLGL